MIERGGETTLPADVIALGRREAASDPPDLVRQRVLTRLRQTITTQGGAGGLTLPAPGQGGDSSLQAATPTTAVARSPARIAAGWAAKGAMLLALAGGGAGLHAWLRPSAADGPAASSPDVRSVSASASAPAPLQGSGAAERAAVAGPASGKGDPAASGATANPHVVDRNRGRRAPPASTLAAERALLDEARRALVHGDARGALAPLNKHATVFVRGQLIEERESMWVKALVLAGRGAEADARAASFRRRFPQSLFSPAVEAALRARRL